MPLLVFLPVAATAGKQPSAEDPLGNVERQDPERRIVISIHARPIAIELLCYGIKRDVAQ